MDRNDVGLPFSSKEECYDFDEFSFKQMALDEWISIRLNYHHEKMAQQANHKRVRLDHFSVGQPVWILRPRPAGGVGLKTWWKGPYKINSRVGEFSYKLETKPGKLRDAHLD